MADIGNDPDWLEELAHMACAAGGAPPSTNTPDRSLRYETERNLAGALRHRGAVIFADGTIALVPTQEPQLGAGPRGHAGAIDRKDPSLLDDLEASYHAGLLVTVEAFRVLLDGVPTMRATGSWEAAPELLRNELLALARAHGARRIELREMVFESGHQEVRFLDL